MRRILERFSIRDRPSRASATSDALAIPGSSSGASQVQHNVPENLVFLKDETIPSIYPPLPEPGLQKIYVELDMKVDVVVDQLVTSLVRVLAPLVNLTADYNGLTRYRNLWSALAILTAYGIKEGSTRMDLMTCTSRLCQGFCIQIESLVPFEMDPHLKWAQSVKYLCDGIRTEWTFRGELLTTRVKYCPRKVQQECIDYLTAMGIQCKLGTDETLIFLM